MISRWSCNTVRVLEANRPSTVARPSIIPSRSAHRLWNPHRDRSSSKWNSREMANHTLLDGTWFSAALIPPRRASASCAPYPCAKPASTAPPHGRNSVEHFAYHVLKKQTLSADTALLVFYSEDWRVTDRWRDEPYPCLDSGPDRAPAVMHYERLNFAYGQ